MQSQIKTPMKLYSKCTNPCDQWKKRTWFTHPLQAYPCHSSICTENNHKNICMCPSNNQSFSQSTNTLLPSNYSQKSKTHTLSLPLACGKKWGWMDANWWGGEQQPRQGFYFDFDFIAKRGILLKTHSVLSLGLFPTFADMALSRGCGQHACRQASKPVMENSNFIGYVNIDSSSVWWGRGGGGL